MKITTPGNVEEKVTLMKGFKEYIFEASAQPYAAISCSSVMVTWVSQTKENLKSCQAEGKKILATVKFFTNELYGLCIKQFLQ